MKDIVTMQKVIILGTSSGIGRKLALQLVKENHHITIIGRRTQNLEKLKA